MDAPVEPRAQDFGLTEANLSRLERHWYSPIDSHAGPPAGATIWVRGLRPKHLVILGVALAALRIFVWARGEHESLAASITLTLFGTLFFAGALGALAGALVAALVVRPIYLFVATALVDPNHNTVVIAGDVEHHPAVLKNAGTAELCFHIVRLRGSLCG
jgi:hypothetical protein